MGRYFAALLLLLPACGRADRVSEKVAELAAKERAATLASAWAAAAGTVPLGQPGMLSEATFAEPTSPSCYHPASAFCSLDLIDYEPVTDVVTIPRGTPVRLIGWAADMATRSVPPVVVL